MEAILERDGDLCVWCSVQFDDRLNPATTESITAVKHQIARFLNTQASL